MDSPETPRIDVLPVTVPGEKGQSQPELAHGTWEGWGWGLLVATGLTVAFAVALRVRMMFLGRSLWLDEAALALNLCGRSFSELLKPLANDQAAPIGFLLTEHASVLAFGPTEFALRLFPFLASLAALALVYRLCQKNVNHLAGLIGLALLGVMPAILYYAGEVKQYELDIAIALGLLVLGAEILRTGLTVGKGIGLALAGSLAIWFSHPSVFVLAGVGTTLFCHEVVERRYRQAAFLLPVIACWLLNFGFEYFYFLKPLQSNRYLDEYWQGAFLRFPPRSPWDLRVYFAVAFGLFEALLQNGQYDVDLSLRMGVFLASAWLIGVVTLYHQGQRRLLWLLLSPLCFVLLASLLHKYPLKSRLALFTAASTLPTIAVGLASLLTSVDTTKRWIGGILVTCALLLPTVQGMQFLIQRPPLVHDARGILTRLARDWKPGDIVIIDDYSAPPFDFYQTYGKIEGLDRVEPNRTKHSLSDAEGMALEIPRWKGRARVWFVLDTTLPDPHNLARGSLKVLLDGAGEAIESFTSRRYSAHLYDFQEGDSEAGPDRVAQGLAR